MPAWEKNFMREVKRQERFLTSLRKRPGWTFRHSVEENEKLNETQYTQIAILACEAAILGAVREAGLAADVSAGLSLGEYGALITSGVLDMETAFRVVRQRGVFMQEAVPTGGAMAAVIGMDGEQIRKICQETEGRVSVANYNCPGQVVITGEDTAVERAGMALKEAGARRVLPLKVSGPFHSPMLEGAGKKLAEVLKTVTVQAPVTPYVTNVTAEYVTEEEAIKELLAKQVASSVLWQQSVERMIADGVDTFVEIGPGKTLTGFLRKIDCSVKGFSIEKPEDLEKVLEKESPIDAMVHLGDVEGSEDYIRILTDAPVYMVAGNNDFYTDLPGQAVIDLDGYRAFITHGHGYHVSYSPNRLVAEALHRNAQIAMYGHTHVPHLEQVEGVIVLNPGSLSYPRQAGREPSYIIMETTPDKQVHFDIRYLRK